MFHQKLILFACLVISAVSVHAANPDTLQQGRALFEREWSARSPQLGNDGLGPLFNAKSCAICHHQGGIGGGGDAEFNAHAVGVEEVEFNAENAAVPGDATEQRQLIRDFLPGLVQDDGTILNSAPLPHHGGSQRFTAIRERLLAELGSLRSDSGGAIDTEAVHSIFDAPIYYESQSSGQSKLRMTLKARVFQRNTTSLFGAGLIDQVSEDQIRDQARAQRAHDEISGRPSILRNGSIGRFGWRGNVERLIDFVEQACVNELSLQTKRRPQASDPANPNYRNPGVDIANDQIKTMAEFVGNLPPPVQFAHDQSESLAIARRGSEAFASVGCAVCHVPNLGPAKGAYTDLLLHDMGRNLYDYDAAEPYVQRQKLVSRISEIPNTRVEHYYGRPSPVTVTRTGNTRSGISDRFVSPRGREAGTEFIGLESEYIGRGFVPTVIGPGRRTATAELIETTGIERTLKASNTTQEWRTPPLWGVADSAPYLHDGRAETLLEAIVLHDGEAAKTRDRFLDLSLADRHAVIAFLNTLVAPPHAPQAQPARPDPQQTAQQIRRR